MIQMEKILLEKKNELEELITELEKTQAIQPEGSLRIVCNKEYYSYYHYLPSQTEKYPLGKYIPKKEKAFAKTLAQKDYDARVLKWAKECYGKLEKLLAVYRDDQCSSIYEKLSAGRKELVQPCELSGDMLAEQWLSIPYSGKEFRPETVCFVTEKGEKVRSKSEKILADYFWRKGIPYKYESPLKLKRYGTIYPDFTILNKRSGQVIYWEHLGMMDNPEYAQKAIMKIHNYEFNGIFPGKDLLLSYEINNDLNMEAVNALIQEFLV